MFPEVLTHLEPHNIYSSKNTKMWNRFPLGEGEDLIVAQTYRPWYPYHLVSLEIFSRSIDLPCFNFNFANHLLSPSENINMPLTSRIYLNTFI